jgi:hypothetical protein
LTLLPCTLVTVTMGSKPLVALMQRVF